MFVFHLGVGAPAFFFVLILLEMAGQSHSIWHRPRCQGKEEAGVRSRLLFSVSHGSLLSSAKPELGSNLGSATY